MADPDERELLIALRNGDDAAFARAYDLFQQRVRIAAWRISHRADWVDEMLSEAWSRAFRMRATYDPERPFLVWIAGIVHNVYREMCKRSPLTLGNLPEEDDAQRMDPSTPEQAAGDAELLDGLNDCLKRLPEDDVRVVRLRFFDGLTLRIVAQEVNVAESTLRESRIPAILDKLRRCLKQKGLEIDQFFSAQEGTEGQ